MNASPAPPLDDDPKLCRKAAAAGLWALVLLVHGWGLAWGMQQTPVSLPVPPARTPAAMVQARLLTLTAPVAPASQVAQVAARTVEPTAEPTPTAAAKSSASRSIQHQHQHQHPNEREPFASKLPNPPVQEEKPEPTPAPAPAFWPTYVATPPPATTRHYLLQRGARSAPARLVWAPSGPPGSNYQLSFMAEGGDLDGLGAASLGSIGPQGLLPQRHLERRGGRDVRATNIDLAAGSVRGSGGGLPHPWVAGGQDALSWVVQLAAVLQANPELTEAGAQVRLAVASARAGVSSWAFDVQGSTTTLLADGTTVPSLFLRRSAAHPYDLQVEVWLDPADHHWPLRLRLSTPPGPWESVWLSIAAVSGKEP